MRGFLFDFVFIIMPNVDIHINKSLTKLMNNELFKEIYPMIEKVEVYEIDLPALIIVKINVNDPEMTESNMYERGLDPHYLIDKHMAKFLPYYSVNKQKKIGFLVVGVDGNVIYRWIP